MPLRVFRRVGWFFFAVMKKSTPVCQMVAPRVPAEQCQPFAVVPNHIAKLFAPELRALGIVLFIDRPLVAVLLILSDEANFQTNEDLLFAKKRLKGLNCAFEDFRPSCRWDRVRR
jgi:hypothetical protein